MKFKWVNGKWEDVHIDSNFVGIQKGGRRPYSVEFDRDDLETLSWKDEKVMASILDHIYLALGRPHEL